jgi:hypothetical protein
MMVMMAVRDEQAPAQAQPADCHYRKAKNPSEPPQNAMEHVSFLV